MMNYNSGGLNISPIEAKSNFGGVITLYISITFHVFNFSHFNRIPYKLPEMIIPQAIEPKVYLNISRGVF